MLGRKTTLILLNSFVGAILGLVALKVVAQFMGVDIYGRYAFALGISGFFLFIVDLGFNRAHVKRVSEGRPAGDCLVTYGVVLLVLSAVYLGVTFGAIAAGGTLLGKRLESTTFLTLLFVITGRFLSIVRRVAGLTFRARREVARGETAGFAASATQSVAMILFALLYAGATRREGPLYDHLLASAPGVAELIARNGAELLGLAFLLSAVVATPIAFLVLRRHYEFGSFDTELFKSYLRYAAPLMVGVTMSTVALEVDKVALGFFWSETEAGLFFGVQRLLVMLTMVQIAVHALIFPTISDLHSDGDVAGVRRLTRRAVRYVSMVLVPAAFALTVLARPAINLVLSAQWLAAAPILAVLAFATLLNAIADPFSQVLFGFDRPKLGVATGMVKWTAQIGLVFLLVPDSLFGVPLPGLRGLGAAVALLVASALYLAAVAVKAHELAGTGFILHLSSHWVAAAVMAGVVWWFHNQLFPLVRWFHVPPYVLGGAALYFGLLALMREFTRKDLDFVLAALHPGEMGRYIRSELSRGPRE